MSADDPAMGDLGRLTVDRSPQIAGMACLEEMSGFDWAIENKLAPPLSQVERAAFALRKAELQRRAARC